LLNAAGMSPQAARVEIACRLFEAGKLPLWPAALWAELSRVEFEDELRLRGIPLYRPTWEQVSEEVRQLARMGI
jgi:predicted HTH domain antitoxin